VKHVIDEILKVGLRHLHGYVHYHPTNHKDSVVACDEGEFASKKVA